MPQSFFQEYTLQTITRRQCTFKTNVLRTSSAALRKHPIYGLTIPTSPFSQVLSTTAKCILPSSFQLSLALAPLLFLNTSMHTFMRRRTSSSTPSGKRVLTLWFKSTSRRTMRLGVHHLLRQPLPSLTSRRTTTTPTQVDTLGVSSIRKIQQL